MNENQEKNAAGLVLLIASEVGVRPLNACKHLVLH